MSLSPAQLATHLRLQKDYPFFASVALKVKTKAGGLSPFIFNRAQHYIHEQLEDQMRRTGRVRAIILKARQEGASTYVAGRFYHKTTRQKYKSTFILSHEAETTGKLFNIVERFQEHCPPNLKPNTKLANRRQYVFEAIGSDYAVGTAGNDNVGRGGTIQYFHGSEVAFWENTDGIETGVMQCIPDMDGTEIILESTANGMGNMFYEKCMQAMDGQGQYILIFIPWFWMPEYTAVLPDDFVLTAEEAAYAKMYNLDAGQMAWRRAKILDLKSEWKFRQEYPANPIEAFQASGSMLINSELIMAARRSGIQDPNAPLVMGVDPGRNRDRSVLAYRRGRQLLSPTVYNNTKENPMNEMRFVGIVAKAIDKMDPVKCFLDTTSGFGVHDRLHELGYKRVIGVHFGEEAMEPDLYGNKRAEMWCLLRDWIHEGGVSIPDNDKLHADLASMPDAKEKSNGALMLLPKDEIRRKFKKSPDIGDAVALTFAFPIFSRQEHQENSFKKKEGAPRGGSLSTLKRMRSAGRRPAAAA